VEEERMTAAPHPDDAPNRADAQATHGEIPREHVLYEEDLPGGCHWSLVVNRGWTLRLTDLEGGANVAALLVNKDEKAERYCMPDTLKAQHTAVLGQGLVCYSDMGRILMSITGDTCGGHDTLCGTTNASLVTERFGGRTYQEARNDWHRNGRDSLLVELGRWGLDRRDLVPNINFFSRVTVDANGRTSLVPNHSAPGSHVDLRAEMNVLVLLSATPHPFHPAGDYPRKPVRMTIWKSGPAGPDDPCRRSRPENERGFRNTEALFAHERIGADASFTENATLPSRSGGGA
jgi:hypothetical protein